MIGFRCLGAASITFCNSCQSLKYLMFSFGSFCLKDKILKSGIWQSQLFLALVQIDDNRHKYLFAVAFEHPEPVIVTTKWLTSILVICDNAILPSRIVNKRFNLLNTSLELARFCPYSSHHLAQASSSVISWVTDGELRIAFMRSVQYLCALSMSVSPVVSRMTTLRP